MSTEIRSVMGRVRLTRDGASIGVETTEVGGDVYGVMRAVTRADFLAAVATECNAIVIDRADLPEIEYDPNPGFTPVNRAIWPDGTTSGTAAVDIGGGPWTAAGCRKTAQHMLALAEYLDAHPQVDEAQVEALAQMMRDLALDGAQPNDGTRADVTAADLARRLLATGRIEVKP